MKKNEVKRALVTGVMGQDGSYLAELLIDKGYEVFGLIRPDAKSSDEKIIKGVKTIKGDFGEEKDIARAVEEAKPDEVYNLAAISDLGNAMKFPELTMKINYLSVGELVKKAWEINPKVKFFQASSSEMFKRVLPPQGESTPLEPRNIYAEAKIKAYEEFIVEYREKKGVFSCTGFLFNHESSRRDNRFVTRKITSTLARIKQGSDEVLELGNLDAHRDWGFAGDYVRAMWLMMQQEKPEDFVIASGKSHMVSEFVDAAAKELGMVIKWKGVEVNKKGYNEKGEEIVRVNENFYRPNEPITMIGDITKAKRVLGWEPEVDFEELVAMMVREDLRILKL